MSDDLAHFRKLIAERTEKLGIVYDLLLAAGRVMPGRTYIVPLRDNIAALCANGREIITVVRYTYSDGGPPRYDVTVVDHDNAMPLVNEGGLREALGKAVLAALPLFMHAAATTGVLAAQDQAPSGGGGEPLADLLAKIKDHREHGAGSTVDLIETIVEELDQRMGEIDRRLMVAEEALVDDWVEERENDPPAPPCVARWEMLGTLHGQPCVERGPHEKHRTAIVGGVMGEWSDPEVGAVTAERGSGEPLAASPAKCCATMRGRAVAEIEREIASVQKIRRLSEEERATAVEFLTYAANHVRALEIESC